MKPVKPLTTAPKKAAPTKKEAAKPPVVPKLIGDAVDKLYMTRSHRLALGKEIKDDQEIESAIKEHLIATLPVSAQTGAVGKVAKVRIETDNIPTVTDWPAFLAWVYKNKRGDLLQRRLNEEGIRELWDAKKKVPGVEPFIIKKVLVSKK